MIPKEGMNVIAGIWPKGGANLTTMYLGLFSSQSPTTVITISQGIANITDAAFTNYARQAMAAATWGALADWTSGRQTTYPQVTFPACGVTGATINGFFIADAVSAGNCIGQSNFSDLTAITLVTLDVIKVTPTILFASG
jgi:hypothetical protein